MPLPLFSDRKVVSLIRPDVSLAGGFTQVKKIAAMAEAALEKYPYERWASKGSFHADGSVAHR